MASCRLVCDARVRPAPYVGIVGAFACCVGWTRIFAGPYLCADGPAPVSHTGLARLSHGASSDSLSFHGFPRVVRLVATMCVASGNEQSQSRRSGYTTAVCYNINP